MLGNLQSLLTEVATEQNKVIACTGALLGVLAMVPPALFFACRSITRPCRETKPREEVVIEKFINKKKT